MALIFERIQTGDIAHLSYLIGDNTEGVAAVFDPRADVDCYLQLARERRVAITHIFETHIHADFVSGARELCAQVKQAKIFLSHEGSARYGFDHEAIKDGDTFTFGSVVVTVRHTPGHTPEHVAFLLTNKDRPDVPWGVLSGDSLLVGSVGLPILPDKGQRKRLAAQQFQTLRNFYLKLADSVIIYPAHGNISPNGENIGQRLSSTIGYEWRFNVFLQFYNETSFTDHILSFTPPTPTYYPRLKRLNTKGPVVLGNLPSVRGLPPKLFQQALKDHNNVLVDTRTMSAFFGGHIKGALNIGDSSLLSCWAGCLLDPAKSILLVIESKDKLEEIVRLFLRIGYTKFAGYLVGGITGWCSAGLPLEEVGQMTVHEVKSAGRRLQLLDVRTPEEWKSGHIPDALHIFLGEFRKHLGELDKTKPTAVYCDNGYRASIGASILKQEGFGSVCTIPGGWQVWKKAGFPVEKGIPIRRIQRVERAASFAQRAVMS